MTPNPSMHRTRYSGLPTFRGPDLYVDDPANVWGVASYLFEAATCTAVGFSEFGRTFVKALAWLNPPPRRSYAASPLRIDASG